MACLGRSLVVADGDDGAPAPAASDRAGRAHRDGQADEAEEVQPHVGVEGDAAPQHRRVDVGRDEPGEVLRRQEVGRRADRERQRGHGQERAADPQRGEADEQGDEHGHDDSGDRGEGEVPVVALIENARRRATETHERELAQRDLPGPTREHDQ